MAINNNNIKIFLLIWTGAVLLAEYVAASQMNNCTEVKCPTISDCPSDSYIRELHFNEISPFIDNHDDDNNNDNDGVTDINNNLDEEILQNCCIQKICSCKLCHRPSCHNSSLVLMEIIKETDIPGKCCGEYECIQEPNCTEIQNTKGLGWLIDCQRCECLAGQKICHRSCDEIRLPPANCIGQNSKIYSNGQIWKEDECTQCECNMGEKKCQTSFCKPLNCPNKIKLPGECCAECVTTESTTTLQKESAIISTITTTTPLITTPPSSLSPSSSLSPCQDGSIKDYSVRTEYVEVIQTSRENCILYGIIVALCIILAIFITLYCYEKSKQRSYRPVTNLDDNYNKIKLKIGDF